MSVVVQTLRAPAKLNLHLRVFPKAGDGFHPLRSWFRTIRLHDRLRLETLDENRPLASPLQRADSDVRDDASTLELLCSDPALATDGTNLVRAAWDACAAIIPLPRARATLTKRIPAGGGLGGGSSDAATMLLAVMLHLAGAGHKRLAAEDPMRLAGGLGSDVPFFVQSYLAAWGDATCTGRGERVAPFGAGRRHAALVLLTDIPCPTPAVYRRFDELPAPPDDGEPDFEQWSALPASELLPLLRKRPRTRRLRPAAGPGGGAGRGRASAEPAGADDGQRRDAVHAV